MKRYFITGLVILLPLALTIAIVSFIFNLLTEPFVGIVRGIFNHYGLFQTGFLFFTSDQIQQGIGQLFVLLFLFLFTIFLGFIGRWIFINYLIDFWERLLHRIPFINTIYKTCKDVIQTIFKSETNSFKQVVMIRFPNQETYSIGLVTAESLEISSQKTDLVSVFVPTTPNPTCGFLIMYPRSDLVYLDMKTEDAFKYIISCGVIIPPFTKAKSKDSSV